MAKQTNDSEALGWVVRVSDPAFNDWADFQAWLEVDPANAARYHGLSADVDEVVGMTTADARPVSVPRATSTLRHRYWLVGALAASIAAVVAYPTLWAGAQSYGVETAAGEMRTVKLADGSTVTLGGATRVVLDRGDPRVATLDKGQAVFDVRHNAGDPFKVMVGGRRLVDVGTVFDVKRMKDTTRVAVAEGAVDFDADGASMRLVAGQGLIARDGDAVSASTRVAVATVGDWRSGTLSYDGVPIAEVAGDLARSLGLDVKADSSVAARPFYGSIVVAEMRRDPAQMAVVLDMRARRSGVAWVLTSR